MIDVTPEREPEPVEVKPEIDDDDPADGRSRLRITPRRFTQHPEFFQIGK